VPGVAVMPATGEVMYLVLAERAVPYLLARVRWPDVAQAISAAAPDWLDDPGLFDLPYNPGAVMVSFPQAASVAAGWGRRLHTEAADDVPSYIRRMPANWSDLSPSERRTWGIEFVGRRRTAARRIRRPRLLRAKTADFAPAAQANSQLAEVTGVQESVASERRHLARVRLDGRAHIRCENTTISPGLVDLGERGMRCVLPEAAPLVRSGTTLRGPMLLEVAAHASRICLDVAGQVSWQQGADAATHFGVAFGELADDETDGIKRLLAAANRKGGHG